MPHSSITNTSGAPFELRCEYMDNPLGIDEAWPRVSWKVNDQRRGAVQSAYQILAASSEDLLAADKGDIWDTGKIESDQNIQVEYDGPVLTSRQRCYWKVRTWDAAGEPSPWSEVQWWEMGLLLPSEWQASWIAWDAPVNKDTEGRAVYLRKTFTVDKPIARSRIYASAKGIYELSVNGQRVSEDLFRPGWTDYEYRIQYQAYDITQLLREGENVVAATLGDGWYCGQLAYYDRAFYGPKPWMLAQLEVQHEDGEQKTIVTDDSWQVSGDGPITFSGFLPGETYDARKEMPGWNNVGFDVSTWTKPDIESLDPQSLVAQVGPGVRRIREVPSVAVTQPSEGTYVFDLGQNMAGWLRLKVHNIPAGTKLTMRTAEFVTPDGNIHTENIPRAESTDRYITKGEAEEAWEPAFTSHGFQYVELTGYPGEPPLDTITGVVLCTDLEETGTFECSDERINKLQENIMWGQRSNFIELATDCPQRGERLGFTGDLQVFIRTACFNMQITPLVTRWMADLEIGQCEDGSVPMVAPDILRRSEKHRDKCLASAGWAEAMIICPWTLYQCYGDKRILERYYGAMAKWIDYCSDKASEFVLPAHTFGDWLSHYAFTPHQLITTAFFAHSADLMSRIAGVLAIKEDEAKYTELFDNIKKAFAREFVTPSGRVAGETQTAYVLALKFNLIPEELRQRAAQYLVNDIQSGNYWMEPNQLMTRDGHLSVGFLGMEHICNVLTETGHNDIAYQLLFNDTCPSWLYPITLGATTMWERWDSVSPDGTMPADKELMNSLNHYAAGSVGQWLYRVVAGLDLDPAQHAYKKVTIHPRPMIGEGHLTSARASYDSIHGTVESAWAIEGDRLVLRVLLPANTTGTVHLPATSINAVKESGNALEASKGIGEVVESGSEVICHVGAGQYEFEMDLAEVKAALRL